MDYGDAIQHSPPGVFTLDDDASNDFNTPLMPAARHNHPAYAARYWQRFSMSGIVGATVLAPRLCGASAYICILQYLWTPGCGVLVWGRCRGVRVVPIPPAGVPEFYSQTGWNENFRQLTIRIAILIRHLTILRWLFNVLVREASCSCHQ